MNPENINTYLERTQENLHKVEEQIDRYAKIREIASDPYNRQKRPEDDFVAKGFFENFYQLRMERKGRKKDREEYWHKGSETIYGKDEKEAAPSTKHTVLTLNFGETPKAIKTNTERALSGPDIEGETQMGKRWLLLMNLGALATGNISARDYTKNKGEIKATRPKHGNKSHRASYKRARNANENFERTGMLSDSVRNWRRNRLLRKIEELESMSANKEQEQKD